MSAGVQLTLHSGPATPAQLAAWCALWAMLLAEPMGEKGKPLEGATPSGSMVLSRAATANDVPEGNNYDDTRF